MLKLKPRGRPPTGTQGWCVYLGNNVPNSCFADPVTACQAQYAIYGGPGEFQGASATGTPFIKQCQWEYTPGWSYPATATFTCDSWWTREISGSGAICTNGTDPKLCDHCAPGGNNPTTPYPIAIFNGAKIFRDTDFTSADGTLSLDRTFVSLPYGDLGTSVISSSPSLANWSAFFDVQLQMSSDWDNGGALVIMNPAGDSEKFQLQSNGTLAPYSEYYNSVPSSGWQVSFVGTLPSNLGSVVSATSQWTVTDPSNKVWNLQTYLDQTGQYRTARPTTMQRPDGTVLTFTYDPTSNLLTTITDQNGKSMSLTWTAGGTIDTVTLPGGYSVKYKYDDSSGNPQPSTSASTFRLREVDYLDATGTVQDSKSYAYGNTSYPSFVTGILDSAGNTRWQAAYNAQGQATYSAGPGGAYAETLTYDPNNSDFTRTQTDALGREAIYHYHQSDNSGGSGALLMSVEGVASAHAPATTKSFTYTNDSNLFLASTTDENGNTTQYTRNSYGFPTQIIEAFGTSNARTTNITWDANFNEPDQVVQSGLTTNYTYDGQGRLTSESEVDTTTTTAPYSTNGQTRTWTYTWGTSGGALGKVVSIDGPLAGTGDTTSLTYNANGYLASVTDPVGHTTTVTSWDWRGDPLTVIEPNGITTTFTYDIHGRPLTTTINPGAAQSQFAFSYDMVGNLTQITLPSGGYLQYAYDSASRLTQIENEKGETLNLSPDGMGNVTQSTIEDAAGSIQQQQNMLYDELGRLIQTIGSASTTATTVAYDNLGNPTSTVDGRSKTWSGSFDQLNRLTTATNPENQSVTYGYDSLDNLVDHKDARNLETTRVVDGFGDVIGETSPDRGTLTYWYDNNGNMTKRIDGDGVETDFTYDAAGRPTTEAFPASTAENITFTYDATASGNNGVGRLTSVSEQSGSSAFNFDARGRMTKNEKVIQGQTYDVTYGYDANDDVTQITLPSGRVVTFARDADGLVTGVTTKASATAAPSTLAASIAYAPFGPLTSLTYGNGLVLTKTYNTNYWLTRIQVTGAATPTFDIGYQRFDDGTLSEMDDNAATGRSVTMSSSDSGRLTSATGPWGAETYAWDANGNRTQDNLTVGGTTTSTNAIVDSASNRITGTTDALGAAQRTLTYRTGGDLMTDTAGGATVSYVYNARKRLTEIEQNGFESADYGYDFRDQRVWRKIVGLPSTTIHYIFDEDGHLLAEHDGSSGAVLREYVWLDDMPIAVIDSTSGSPIIYYIHAGQLNEPQVMTDSSQTSVWNAYMSPFGQAQVFTNGAAALDMRLPGQWFEAEAAGAGLNQNAHRDYDPSLGRYIEVDPLGIDAGPNPYGYVNGAVYDGIDPSGLIVRVVSSDPTVVKTFENAYAKMNQTARGREINRKLENSPIVYKIKDVRNADVYCNAASVAAHPDDNMCAKNSHNVLIDLQHLPCANTTDGVKPVPLVIELAHELGHAYGEANNDSSAYDSDSKNPSISGDRMSNVNENENPIRQQLGYPLRISYDIDGSSDGSPTVVVIHGGKAH